MLVFTSVTAPAYAQREPLKPIEFYNRETGQLQTEVVMGQGAIRFGYKTKFGKFLMEHILSKRWPSRLMGFSKNRKRSAKKIPAFIEHYQIDMTQFEEVEKYKNFNEFFSRKFKPEARTFDPSPTVLSAGAEGRYLVMENISQRSVFPVKATQVFLPELLGDKETAQEFEGGTIVIARLSPVDYHRFHFPLNSRVLEAKTIHGLYHSVNPIALEVKPDILFKNERQVAILDNKEFGKYAMIEVGAFAVGKIVQTAYEEENITEQEFQKGQEKGTFLFGGSTVIWVFKKGAVRLDKDLIQNSAAGYETLVKLGDQIGVSSVRF